LNYTPVPGQPFGHFQASGYHVTGPHSIERVIDADTRKTAPVVPQLQVPDADLLDLKTCVADLQKDFTDQAIAARSADPQRTPKCVIGIPTPANSCWLLSFDYSSNRYRARYRGYALDFSPSQVQSLF
jgi:hypothetical protein